MTKEAGVQEQLSGLSTPGPSPLQRVGKGMTLPVWMERVELQEDLLTSQGHSLRELCWEASGCSCSDRAQAQEQQTPGLGCVATGEQDGNGRGWRS